MKYNAGKMLNDTHVYSYIQYSITTMLFERTRIRLSTMYPFFFIRSFDYYNT